MQKYDLTVMVKTDLTEEAQTKFSERIEKLIKTLEGKPGKLSEMGRKQLTYRIAKQTEAIFLNWALELPAGAVVQLEKKLTVDKDILRHLLVVAE